MNHAEYSEPELHDVEWEKEQLRKSRVLVSRELFYEIFETLEDTESALADGRFPKSHGIALYLEARMSVQFIAFLDQPVGFVNRQLLEEIYRFFDGIGDGADSDHYQIRALNLVPKIRKALDS